jgi:hypothetical protein
VEVSNPRADRINTRLVMRKAPVTDALPTNAAKYGATRKVTMQKEVPEINLKEDAVPKTPFVFVCL